MSFRKLVVSTLLLIGISCSGAPGKSTSTTSTWIGARGAPDVTYTVRAILDLGKMYASILPEKGGFGLPNQFFRRSF